MNPTNETIRILKTSISHYEKMSMLARSSSERIEYKQKAELCRDELNLILKEVDSMTAKRFKLAYADYDWWAICDKENPTELGISGEDVVELLNELSEENEQLRHDATILIQSNQDYRKENEQLKQQLLYGGDDVCSICKHEYLVPRGDYFIGKCKKGHKECAKVSLKYCKDFEKELEE